MQNTRHIIPISGKDSLATALFLKIHKPNIDFEYMFNPTGQELPEVFEWLNKVEKYLGKEIVKVGKDLKQIITEKYNYFLPSRNKRYCTNESKIQPMEKYLGETDLCYVYYGIRADEERIGYVNKSNANIIPQYPLKEWGITLPFVYQINFNAGLKPPTMFWQRLYDAVVKVVGENIVKSLFTEWEIDALFSWRSRMNCAMCFNQRRYEWVGLLEYHPNLFWEYETWEHNGSEYYLNGKDYSLKNIAENKDQIFQNRVDKIVKYIENRKQYKIDFEDDSDNMGYVDILSVTSCGLLCGK